MRKVIIEKAATLNKNNAAAFCVKIYKFQRL